MSKEPEKKYKGYSLPEWLSFALTPAFILIIAGLTWFSILSITQISDLKSNKIEYTITIDQSVFKDKNKITVLNPEAIEKSLIQALNDSTTTYILENTNNAINRIYVTVTVSAVFFTMLVVVVSLFQFMKSKDFEKQYEQHRAKIESIEKTFEELLRTETDKFSTIVDQKTTALNKEVGETRSELESDIEKAKDIMKDLDSKISKLLVISLGSVRVSEGTRLFGEADHESALESFEAASKVEELQATSEYMETVANDIVISAGLGMADCYMRLKAYESAFLKFKEVIEKYKDATRISSLGAQVYFKMSTACLQYYVIADFHSTSLLMDAKESILKAIEIEPTKYTYYRCLAKIYKRLFRANITDADRVVYEITISKNDQKIAWLKNADSACDKAIDLKREYKLNYLLSVEILILLINLVDEQEQVDLFVKAIANYEEYLLRAEPEDKFDHLGKLCLLKARSAILNDISAPEKDALYDEFVKRVEFLGLVPEARMYEFSCAFALLDRKDDAKNCLRFCINRREVPVDVIRDNKYLINCFGDVDAAISEIYELNKSAFLKPVKVQDVGILTKENVLNAIKEELAKNQGKGDDE